MYWLRRVEIYHSTGGKDGSFAFVHRHSYAFYSIFSLLLITNKCMPACLINNTITHFIYCFHYYIVRLDMKFPATSFISCLLSRFFTFLDINKY